jgi:hypothetical protein
MVMGEGSFLFDGIISGLLLKDKFYKQLKIKNAFFW